MQPWEVFEDWRDYDIVEEYCAFGNIYFENDYGERIRKVSLCNSERTLLMGFKYHV